MKHALPPRDQVPRETTWDLDSIFRDLPAWEAAFVAADDVLSTLSTSVGTLAQSAALADFLDRYYAIYGQVMPIAVYAHLGYAVDTADTDAAARADRAQGLVSRFGAAAAFAEPEMLTIGPETLLAWADSEPRLGTYRHYFERLARRAPHVLSADVENALSLIQDPFRAATRIHGVLCDADLTFPPAVGTDGETQEIGQGTVGKLLTDPDPAVRQSTWEHYADAHLAVRNTLAACLAAGVKQNVVTARLRHYASPLTASLAAGFIPESVFENLLATFVRHMPTWHRYFDLRRRALGQESLNPWDIKAPLTQNAPKIPYRQAVEWIADGMAPLGDDYVAALRRGCGDERWVDVYPNKGKRMGAFSSGTYGTRPFILMSYNDDIFSLSTLAHELGHSLHSYYSRATQPAVTAGYGLFVAEVASNVNQALVRAHLLQRFAGDRDFEIALIEEAMANFHRYFLVMPTLARFEREIHESVWNGQALSARGLTTRMADLFAEAFGTAIPLDDAARERVGSTWMQFSTHLYSNFYVYQYATGISGAHALAEQVLREGEPAAERYRAFLKAGGSRFPLDILRHAGVDLESPEPVEATFATLAGYVDRLETLLTP
jgi:oligoendopeptidase F